MFLLLYKRAPETIKNIGTHALDKQYDIFINVPEADSTEILPSYKYLDPACIIITIINAINFKLS